MAGNASVARLIAGSIPAVQRDIKDTHVLEEADETDVPTWEETQALQTEWGELNAKKKAAAKKKEPFDPADEARFTEVNRLISLRFKKDTAMTLEGNGYKDGPAKWYEDVKDAKFLGQTITVHQKLADKLAEAEKVFLKAVGTEKAPAGGWTRVSSDLRGPGQGLHSYGLAVDLKGGTNPYLVTPSKTSQGATGEPLKRSQAIQDIIDRAVLLVLGKTPDEEKFGEAPAETDKAKRAMLSYDKLEEASNALETYFTLVDPTKKADLDARVTAIAAKDTANRTADDWPSPTTEPRSGPSPPRRTGRRPRRAFSIWIAAWSRPLSVLA